MMNAPQSRHSHDNLFATLRPLIKLDARHLVVLVALVLAVIDRRTSVLNSLKPTFTFQAQLKCANSALSASCAANCPIIC